MTRKDYVLIAAAVSAAAIPSQPMAEFAREAVAVRLADALGRDNPRFDRERFLKACGVQS
jgi:hypothetical protein